MRAPPTSKKSSLRSAPLKTQAARKATLQFPAAILADIQKSKGLRIRAGTGEHRFIGIWFVVVKDRVFVRSWSVQAKGWYRTFLKEPRGAIQVENRRIDIRARPVTNQSLRDAIDQAYLERYITKGSLKYAKDLGSAKSRATTIELIPSSLGATRFTASRCKSS